jgi:5-oxoprolinase (ATP-hydrolysing)
LSQIYILAFIHAGRLTDPEILERRYPVILNRFSLAPGSGGQGKFRGGEGVLREVVQNT